MKEGEDEQLNAILRELDKDQISFGAPILSVNVIMDDPYELCSVAEESIKKYKLRRSGERHMDMVDRLRNELYDYIGSLGKQ